MSKKKPSFEQSLRDLEEVVAKMEHGELPLDECVQYYERGVKLAAACAHELDAARQRIEQLQKNEAGELVTTPFAPDLPDLPDLPDPPDPPDQSA